MSPYVVLPARPVDACWVDLDVRQVDREEWVLASGRPFLPTLEAAIELAQGGARTMWLDGRPLCVWGATPTEDPAVGRAWLVGTTLGQRHVARVQRHFQEGVAELHERHRALDAWAYDRNRLHHHWMERLGFVRTGGSRVLGLGATFIHFRRESERCA